VVLARLLAGFVAASALWGAETSPSAAQEIFNRIRQRVAETVNAAPNYTCEETVVRQRLRSGFQARGGCEDSAFDLLRGTYKPVERDRLRIDVGIANNREVFSWHGQNTFVTGDITSLVSSGTISSGSFFGFLSDIFLNGRGHYFYTGNIVVNGKALASFRYTMPRPASHFVTRTRHGRDVMAYHGDFTADPASGKLHSLTIDTEDIPQDLASCSLDQSVTYQDIMLNGKKFRVPSVVELHSRLIDHDLANSTTRYTNCHEFSGASIVHYNDDPKLIAASNTPIPALPAFPAKHHLKLRLSAPIDSDKAWTGDSVTAILENTLRGQHGRLLAEKGSVLTGRLVQLTEFGNDRPYWIFGIRFERLHTRDGDYRIALNSQSPIDVPTSAHGLWRSPKFGPDDFRPREHRGVGSFRALGDHLLLDRDFVTDWESIAPPSANPDSSGE
jgi:hypothetical protein